jgi:hypothetical protein
MIIETLATFIELFIPNVEIVRSQGNKVSPPKTPCIVLREILQVDLSVPILDYNYANSMMITGPTRIDVQVDFYGPDAGDQCKVLQTVFRLADKFPSNVKPLYTSDGIQSPLITGERQFESRWTLTASLQYNPIVTVPQQYAETATVTLRGFL